MKALLLSGLLIVAVASLGACGPKSEPAKNPPPANVELETISLTIEGMT